MPCWEASDSKTLSCAATTQPFSTDWARERIPDPTTSGDFTRRFDQDALEALMEALNVTRQHVWKVQPPGFLTHAFIDTGGTIAPTLGECKSGMAMSYKGIWGYAPLIVSLANTREVLYLVNSAGQCRQPSRLCALDGPGHRLGPSLCRRDHVAGGHRFYPECRVGSLAGARNQVYLWHGCPSQGGHSGPSPAGKRLEALEAASALPDCH